MPTGLRNQPAAGKTRSRGNRVAAQSQVAPDDMGHSPALTQADHAAQLFASFMNDEGQPGLVFCLHIIWRNPVVK